MAVDGLEYCCFTPVGCWWVSSWWDDSCLRRGLFVSFYSDNVFVGSHSFHTVLTVFLFSTFFPFVIAMNEEVLKIMNEPDRPYDPIIDMSFYDIDDILAEEEVEVE